LIYGYLSLCGQQARGSGWFILFLAQQKCGAFYAAKGYWFESSNGAVLILTRS